MTYALRAWQADALTAWRAAECRGVVEVVTGGGKTVMALNALRSFLDERDNRRARIIVPTLALLDQWTDELESQGIVSRDSLGVVASGQVINPNSPVQLGVVNSFRKVGPLSGEVMLIADEVHRYASPENARALSGDYAATLGLSATPENEFDTRFDDVLVPLVGPIVFRYSLADALRDGIISRFAVSNTRIPLLRSEEAEYSRLSRRIGQAVQTDGLHSDKVRMLLRKRSRVSALAAMRVPVAVRLIEEHAGRRSIVFHESIDHASRIAASLSERGLAVGEYHSRLGSPTRRDNLRQFRRGILDVLVTCRALDEGLNAPDTEVAVIAAATAGARQRVQRMGRVLRTSGASKHAVIHTIFATEPELRRLKAECDSLGALATDVTWREVRSPE